MSAFFKCSQTAFNALNAEFRFKAYYNFGFQLDAITSLICHILRALFNLLYFALRTIITALTIFYPFGWANIPEHLMGMLDNGIGVSLSLVTMVLVPFIFAVRTVISMVGGYEQDTENDWGEEGEQESLENAMRIV